MRQCEVYKIQKNPNWSSDQPLKNKYERVLDFTGLFHCFSTNYDEFNDGPAMYPVAIVELSDGTIEIVNAGLIRFIDPMPADKTEDEIKTAVSETNDEECEEV